MGGATATPAGSFAGPLNIHLTHEFAEPRVRTKHARHRQVPGSIVGAIEQLAEVNTTEQERNTDDASLALVELA